MNGKIAVVTGGNRGLGRYMVKAMAAAGATVIATSRSGGIHSEVHHDGAGDDRVGRNETGEDGVISLHTAEMAGAGEGVVGHTSTPGRIYNEVLDVLSEQSVIDLFGRLESRFPRIDVWVNNAGVGVFKPALETTVEEFDFVMNTNVRGLFLCSREAFRHMKARGGGRIINIASIAGYTPIPENGVYGASKYAVRGFSKILNEEGKDFGVRVSIVSPGAVFTKIWDGREGFSPADMLQPEDVAETVLDIASRPLHVRIDEVKIVPPKGVL